MNDTNGRSQQKKCGRPIMVIELFNKTTTPWTKIIRGMYDPDNRKQKKIKQRY